MPGAPYLPYNIRTDFLQENILICKLLWGGGFRIQSGEIPPTIVSIWYEGVTMCVQKMSSFSQMHKKTIIMPWIGRTVTVIIMQSDEAIVYSYILKVISELLLTQNCVLCTYLNFFRSPNWRETLISVVDFSVF